MPTPNWGPQNGVPMDDATFDAYVAANPPGMSINGVSWGGKTPSLIPSIPSDQLNKTGDTNPYWYNLFKDKFNQQRPNIDFQTGNQDQARTQQQQVIQDLQRQAAGDPNSLAQQQLSQGYGAAQAQQSSLGSTMRGQSAGAAARSTMAGQQGIQRGYAGDQQMLQAQEQQAAQAMLAQLLAQQQGQDINQAQGMAGGTLGSQGLSDAMKQFYGGGMLNADLAATERQNQIGRAKVGFEDQMTALTQNLLNQGMQAGATAVGTYGNFGSKPGGTNG